MECGRKCKRIQAQPVHNCLGFWFNRGWIIIQHIWKVPIKVHSIDVTPKTVSVNLVYPCALADLGGVPLMPKIFSSSCNSLENLAKSYVGAPPQGRHPQGPPHEESWIRPWCGNIGSCSGSRGVSRRRLCRFHVSCPSFYKVSRSTTALTLH